MGGGRGARDVPLCGVSRSGSRASNAGPWVVVLKVGQLIGPYDLMIAGHARSRGLIVVTGNLGEFSRVAALRSEDWLAPQ